MKRVFALFAFSLILSVVSITAQTPSPTPPVTEDKDPVVITTNLIQIDATVFDKKGSIVKDLKADDFEIYENGEKQQITNFSFVELQPDKTNEPQVVNQRKRGRNSVAPPPVLRNLRPEQVGRTVALIVDDLGLSFSGVDTVRSSLKRFVDEQMQPSDLVAIIRTGKGGGFLQQFTSDKRILYKAIERIRWNPAGIGKLESFARIDPSDGGARVTVNPTLPAETQQKIIEQHAQKEAQMAAIEGRMNANLEDAFTIGTLGAVNYVVKGMGELPGRKAVVLFSEGFKLYEQSIYDQQNNIKRPNPRIMGSFRRLTELANRSSVVIYAMDVRGVVNALMLRADDNFEDIDQDGGLTKIENAAISRSTELFETQQGLRALAAETGGFAIINNNNLGKGLERVMNDQRGYYLIGYQPDGDTFDPRKARFNKLTVRLKRPDLRIRYRSGFFGIKDEEAKPQPKTPRGQILAALTSPLNSGDIDLQLTPLFAHDPQTGNFMRSLLYVSGKDLQFTEEAGGWEKATFDVVAMTFGENGDVIDEISRTETIKARAETLKEIREKGFVANITVPIKKPGAYQMRVVMRDNATSRVGSASQFIEIPNLKKERLALSGLLLQRVETNSGDSNQKPFQSAAERDLAIRRFQAGTTVRFGYAIYNAKTDKTAANPNLTMQYRIFRDGKETFVSREKAVKILERPDSARILSEGFFALGKTAPNGDYALQVIVRDLTAKEKNQIAVQWIDFEVAN